MQHLVMGRHYILFLAALAFESHLIKAAVLILITMLSIAALVATRQRLQLIGDTPTSQIQSARYGYVELYGTAAQPEDSLLRDPITHEPCLWFRVVTYQLHTDSSGHHHRTQINTAESSRPFLLTDSSGSCLVLPQRAEYTLNSTVSIPDGKSIKHDLTRIRTGDKLYILGHIDTYISTKRPSEIDSPTEAEAIKQRAREILKSWQHVPAVLKNFDQNKDGVLDGSEIKRARTAALYAAQNAIKNEHSKKVLKEKVVSAPRNGQPYMISSRTPNGMLSLFSNLAKIHIASVLASFMGSMYMML